MKQTEIERLFHLQNEKYIFEDIIQSLYEAVLVEGDQAVDGGANIGRHTLPMAKAVQEKGVVYAYEPVPETVDYLKEKLAHYNVTGVQVRPAALGHQDDTREFIWVKNKSTRSALKNPALLEDSITKSIKVPVVMLDNELASIKGRLRFIKLDLEGGEFDCLRGSTNVLNKHQPIVVLENGHSISGDAYGYTRDEYFDFFESIGYYLIDIFGRMYEKSHWGAKWIPWYIVAVPQAVGEVEKVKEILSTACKEQLV